VDDPIRRQLVRISVTTMSGRSESALFDSRRASPKRWNIESVDFDVETVWGFSIARGRFDRAAGSYVTGREGTKIDVMVDAGSVVTGNELLDNLLRSPELSELAEHPPSGSRQRASMNRVVARFTSEASSTWRARPGRSSSTPS
jgi:polyisoprenoid-binding protein YceI